MQFPTRFKSVVVATETGNLKMIVEYKWNLANSEKTPKTFVSKMILFRGEKVFRVGFKNLVQSPFFFFVAVDLNKMGMKVREVMWGQILDSGISPATMWPMTKQEIGDEGSLHLFKRGLSNQLIGNGTFLFRIHIEGSVPEFSFRLSDRLAKHQLWDAVKCKNWLDVEFVVKGKTFSAHKAILAARSPVFAAEFTKEETIGDASSHQNEPKLKKRKINNGPHQIQIDGVEPTTFEQFLYFIYTGESISSFANEELLKLADDYQLATLAGLCRTALNKIETTQMLNLMNNLHSNTEIPYSFTVSPDEDTEICFDRTTSTIRCASSFIASENGKSKCMMKYRNEKFFFCDFTGEKVTNPTDKTILTISKPEFHFSCSDHRRFGVNVENIYCKKKCSNKWRKMEWKYFQSNPEVLLHLSAQLELDVQFGCPTEVYFDVKIVSTIDNYSYEMMDNAWLDHFWTAAAEQKLTDVEIFVGTVKVMEAHRFILSARSPVLNAAFNKMNDVENPPVIKFEPEFDVGVVKIFLNFLYTASLGISTTSKVTNYKQLLKLATICEVETLKKICELANIVRDAEEVTNCLLEYPG